MSKHRTIRIPLIARGDGLLNDLTRAFERDGYRITTTSHGGQVLYAEKTLKHTTRYLPPVAANQPAANQQVYA